MCSTVLGMRRRPFLSSLAQNPRLASLTVENSCKYFPELTTIKFWSWTLRGSCSWYFTQQRQCGCGQYVLHEFSRRTSSAVFDIGPLIRGSFFGQSNRKDAARVREVFSSWVRFVDNAQGQHFTLSLRP